MKYIAYMPQLRAHPAIADSVDGGGDVAATTAVVFVSEYCILSVYIEVIIK